MQQEMVNHPAHYQSETGLEVIDVIHAFTFDLKGIEAFDTGNALKYLCRWAQKNGVQDLKKAKWYIEHLIAHIEKLEEENDPYVSSTVNCWCVPKFFSSRNEAETVVDRMKEILSRYGFVTVADVFDLIGIGTEYTDNARGWTNLDRAVICLLKEGQYTIFMDEPETLNKGE